MPDTLAMVGHELQSPLAALMISADILADEIDTLDRQARAEVLGAFQRRARALHTLVDNLLHSAGRQLTLEYQAFDAEDLLADVKLAVLPLLAHRAQRLTVGVTFAIGEPVVRIEVADRGCGFPAGPLDWLFQPYARAATGAAGLGLGLSIVRSIVEAHGGRVGAANRPGGGARFWFTIPTTARYSLALSSSSFSGAG